MGGPGQAGGQVSRAARGHALVIGGTGMLRAVCLGLATQGWRVTVVARSHRRLASLAQEAAGGVFPLSADYKDDAALALAVRAATAARGPVGLVVAWIHSDAPRALGVVASMVGGGREACRVFQVVGSGGGAEWAEVSGVAYRRVVLGHVVEPSGARWLTDGEIVAGVMGAIEGDRPESVVGVTP